MAGMVTDHDNTRVQFRITPGSDLQRRLEDRYVRCGGGRTFNDHARGELMLWLDVLQAELERLPAFDLRELVCLAQTLTDQPPQRFVGPTVGVAYARVYRAFKQDGATTPGTSWVPRWQVDGFYLLEKLGGLGPAADHALCDAISRWWADPDRAETAGSFGRVGLRILAAPARTAAGA